MIRATVKTFSYFPETTRAVDELAHDGVQHAAEVAAAVAQENSSIDLQLTVVGVHAVGSAFVAGIKSHKQTRTPGRTTPIARFFDEGTLGGRRRALKQARKQSWQVKRRSGTLSTSTRGPISAGTGLGAERFFAKARLAGRKALVAQIQREATVRFGRR